MVQNFGIHVIGVLAAMSGTLFVETFDVWFVRMCVLFILWSVFAWKSPTVSWLFSAKYGFSGEYIGWLRFFRTFVSEF